MTLSNKQFKTALHSCRPEVVKGTIYIKLDYHLNDDFMFVFYDTRNDVFFRFDMDVLAVNKPTDEQLEITKYYLNNYE
jgi:hypothetical protein